MKIGAFWPSVPKIDAFFTLQNLTPLKILPRYVVASSDADDSDDEVPDHLVTAPVMLRTGLLLMGFTEARIRRAKDETNQERFLNHVGVAASTACAICEDMQLATIADARIKGSELNLKWFLLGLCCIRKCPKASDLESKFDYSKHWGPAGCWDG